MNIPQVIGDLLPLALAVAISPIPIIAAILMLLSPAAHAKSVGFLLGWVFGVILAVVVFTLLSSLVPPVQDDSPSPVAGIIRLVLGLALIALGIAQWRKRTELGEKPELPGWMAGIDNMNPAAAFGLGVLLSTVNPKNFLMAASAGVVVGTAGLESGGTVAVIAIYTLVSILTVAVPIVGYLVASRQLRKPLEKLRTVLVANNSAIMAVLLLVIGVVTVGNGISAF